MNSSLRHHLESAQSALLYTAMNADRPSAVVDNIGTVLDSSAAILLLEARLGERPVNAPAIAERLRRLADVLDQPSPLKVANAG